MPNLINKLLDQYLINPIYEKLKENNTEKVEIRPTRNIAKELSQMNIDPAMFNTRGSVAEKTQPELTIRTSTLRDFSVNYPIARACIDYLKTKITQLDWDITSELDDDEDNVPQDQVKQLRMFFKHPSGANSKLRVLLEQMIEDYLVLGAISIEKVKTFGGQLVELLPVDPATIKLRLNEQGRTPQSPMIAYEQWILGTKRAELTTEELIYEVRNSRTNSPFGLSPLESLIIQVQSSLRGALYNYNFFSESNIPEGFVEMPETWTIDQVKEYQSYFDALLSGDPRYQRKLKFLPNGMKYTPTKKPEDMAFERFELWLLENTCAVFGVPPQDIGFTYQVNKSTGEVQSEKGDERGKRPLVNFIQELFTNIIQNEFNSELAFAFLDVDPTDRLEEAKIDEIKIKMGVLSVDEVRKRDGMDEIGLEHFVMGSGEPILVSDIKSGKYKENATQVNVGASETNQNSKDNKEEKEDKEDDEMDDLERIELKTWKKVALKDFKSGKTRKFKTNYLADDITQDIDKQLDDVKTRDDIVKVFDFYLSGDYKTISKLKVLANELQKSI